MAAGIGRALAGGLLALACTGGAADGDAIQPWDLRERLRGVEAGQSAAAARARLGRQPLHRPGRPGEPFPSPLRSLELVAPSGERVQVELYVVEAHASADCADAIYRTQPVAFAGDVVAAVGWDAVEARWRGWGGTLEALRDARAAGACAEPAR